MNMKKLDLGCGRAKTEGCLGIDVVALPGVDIVHNLSQFPWPLQSDDFELVVSNHYLEHVDDIIKSLGEIHRILASGGILRVRVPHYASDNFHSDLTHKVAFGYRSFDHYATNGNIAYDFYTTFKFEILEREIIFYRGKWPNPFKILGLHFLANRFPRVFERFFAYWLPPTELRFELRAVKT